MKCLAAPDILRFNVSISTFVRFSFFPPFFFTPPVDFVSSVYEHATSLFLTFVPELYVEGTYRAISIVTISFLNVSLTRKTDMEDET